MNTKHMMQSIIQAFSATPTATVLTYTSNGVAYVVERRDALFKVVADNGSAVGYSEFGALDVSLNEAIEHLKTNPVKKPIHTSSHWSKKFF